MRRQAGVSTWILDPSLLVAHGCTCLHPFWWNKIRNNRLKKRCHWSTSSTLFDEPKSETGWNRMKHSRSANAQGAPVTLGKESLLPWRISAAKVTQFWLKLLCLHISAFVDPCYSPCSSISYHFLMFSLSSFLPCFLSRFFLFAFFCILSYFIRFLLRFFLSCLLLSLLVLWI